LSTRLPKGTSLRQNTRFEPATIKFGSAVRTLGEHEKILGKNKNWKKVQQRYISRVRVGGTLVGGKMKLGTLVDLLDVINHANLHLDWMICFCASWGQKKEFTFEMDMALTTLPCATMLPSERSVQLHLSLINAE
jgi:hypothetical protein